MIGAKLIRRTMEVPTAKLDRVNVSVDGGLGIVTPSQLRKHDLAYIGHREFLLCDNKLAEITSTAGSATRECVHRKAA
jgi:hypothetical protein